jgi:conjugative relaxase-like TrwC/TraI family protein
VSKEEFAALAQNRHSRNGTRLTVRTKDDRRAGYDFTFSVPKSVSLHLALGGDAEVERMVMESFQETMALIESTMETRVRAKGREEDRRTGNMVYASFVHRLTRPVDGIPDPHFHIHAFVFNATFDAEENRWKAGQFGGVKTVAPYYEAVFHALLAAKLIENGYPIRRTDRDFELLLSRGLIEKFSKRTQLINEAEKRERTILEAEAGILARKKGIDLGDAYEMVRAEVGARTREKKSECRLSGAELVANWRSQMTVAELAELDQLKDGVSQNLLDLRWPKTWLLSTSSRGCPLCGNCMQPGCFCAGALVGSQSMRPWSSPTLTLALFGRGMIW